MERDYQKLVEEIETNLRFIFLNHLETNKHYYVVIMLDDKNNYYVQAIIDENKDFHLEIPSNHYLINNPYTVEQEKLIKKLGWSDVTDCKMHMKEFNIMKTSIREIAIFATKTIIEVFNYDFIKPLGYQVNFQ